MDIRQRLKIYNNKRNEVTDRWKRQGYQYPPPEFPKLPDDLRNLQCGAKTKSAGTPCKRKDIYSNGRCKLHGGLSTGPKTIEGKRKVAKNAMKKNKAHE